MLTITESTHSSLARADCLRRLASMLVDAGTIRPEAPRDELHAIVAVILDEGEARGIQSERLLGMYLLLRVSDGLEPFDDHEFGQVLGNPALSEADKAHQLQILRLTRLG